MNKKVSRNSTGMTIEEGREALKRAPTRSYNLGLNSKDSGVTKAESERVLGQLSKSKFRIPETLKKH